jgi:hypothetical protein
LVKETILQKHRTAELESQLASRVTVSNTVPGKTQKRGQIVKVQKELKMIRGYGTHKCTSSPEDGAKLNSEQYKALTDKLKSERDFYYNECCRLKEQTDPALADSQGKVIQLEMEFSNCQEHVKQLEKD